jgi:hypothetical protein
LKTSQHCRDFDQRNRKPKDDDRVPEEVEEEEDETKGRAGFRAATAVITLYAFK